MGRNTAAMTALGQGLELQTKAFGDEVAADLVHELVLLTPKGSGRARAGWQVTTSGSVAEPSAPFRAMDREQARSALQGRRAGQDATVGNAVPYLAKIHQRRPFIPQAMANVARKAR